MGGRAMEAGESGQESPDSQRSAFPGRVLVVDDERAIADLVEAYLVREGFEVAKAYDAVGALDQIAAREPDAAILDVMLPDMDGFDLLGRIRGQGRLFPIVMLTARVADADKIAGLAAGADDYLVKPFNPLELVARVKSQLRRRRSYDRGTRQEGPVQEHEVAGLVINNEQHRALLYGRRLDLTRTEFGILWYLCNHRGRPVSTRELYEAVWGEAYLEGSDSTVMAHIARLRAKLGDTARRQAIVKTVWGVGYTVD